MFNYKPINSNIHKMHPVSKIICFLIFLIMQVLTNNIQISIALFFLVLIIIINSNIELGTYLKSIKTFILPIVIIFIFLFILRVKMELILITLINIILLVLYLLIILMTTKMPEINYALKIILSPLNKLGIKTNDIIINITLILKTFQDFLNIRNEILKSMIDKGINYNKSFESKISINFQTFKPAFNQTKEQFKINKTKLSLKLYDLEKPRTYYELKKWKFIDTYLIIMHLAILVLIIMKGRII